ncbi:hypothetical protein QJQ45_023924 [Haematococcus lacustris]|nr:hypothetical protein QJQ45_023924 [Haematococcus lacustris]
MYAIVVLQITTCYILFALLLLLCLCAGEVLQNLDAAATGHYNTKRLLRTAFNRVGSLPMEKINRIRHSQQQVVDKMLQKRAVERRKRELAEARKAAQRKAEQEALQRVEAAKQCEVKQHHMHAEIPDMTPAEQAARALRNNVKDTAKVLGNGLGTVIAKTREATGKLRERVRCAWWHLYLGASGQQEVVGERRQVIKAALRGLVEAARPDLSPAQVDAVVAEMSLMGQ